MCRLVIPLSTGAKRIKIDKEKPELQLKTKWYVYMAHGVQATNGILHFINNNNGMIDCVYNGAAII